MDDGKRTLHGPPLIDVAIMGGGFCGLALARQRLGTLRLEQVGRVASMFEEHREDLPVFLTQDARGHKLTLYLRQLGEDLLEERQHITTLLEDVDRYTAHIGTIVKLQQTYARAPSLNEPVRMEELVEDALRMQDSALAHHAVKVERQVASLPPMLLDKHKVLMILVNLISNARHAMAAVLEGERRLTVSVEPPTDGRIRLEVRDNGIGIAPELLTRIFQRGFTTKSEGHGFGLHPFNSLEMRHLALTLSDPKGPAPRAPGPPARQR